MGPAPPDMKSENLACFQNILAAIAGFAKVETGSCLADDNNKRDCLPHQNHWNWNSTGDALCRCEEQQGLRFDKQISPFLDAGWACPAQITNQLQRRFWESHQTFGTSSSWSKNQHAFNIPPHVCVKLIFWWNQSEHSNNFQLDVDDAT